MIGDASGKEGQFSDSDKKTAENFSGMIIFKDPISLDSDVKIPLLSFTES